MHTCLSQVQVLQSYDDGTGPDAHQVLQLAKARGIGARKPL